MHPSLQDLLRTHWAITEEALRQVLRQALQAPAVALVTRDAEPLPDTRAGRIDRGIATIPVRGILSRYDNFRSFFGRGTSFERLALDLTAAAEDPAVRAILLAVDSPGGEVSGTQETAALLAQIDAVKPVFAHIDGDGNSAAYWLASQAREIAMGNTAIAGSIGVMAVFDDFTKLDQKIGIETITIVSSQSPHKDIDPATPDGRARIQVLLDQLASVFVTEVARGRGVGEDVVLRDFGRGDVMVGAAAVAAGLADRIATFDAFHEELVAQHGTRARLLFPPPTGRLAAARKEKSPMARPSAVTPEPDVTAAELEAAYPAQVASLCTAAATAAATAERERILAIHAMAEAGLETLLAAAVKDPSCTAPMAAQRILEHQRAQRAQQLANLAAEQTAAPPAAPAPTAEPSPAQALVTRAKATFRLITAARDNAQEKAS